MSRPIQLAHRYSPAMSLQVPTTPLRVGLVGAGPWARIAHGPGLASSPDVALAGIWARRVTEAHDLADTLGCHAVDSFDELLDGCDALAFCVPPDVQARMALTAAAAGKHLFLDKPVAIDTGLANELSEEVSARGVASLVFFTDRFVPATQQWLAEVATVGGWQGGWMRWLSALQEPGNPFGASPWRQQFGALWDTGPHALSNLITALGPVGELRATAGAGDLVHLVLQHESGASSTATLSQFVPPAAAGYETTLWGSAGFATMPQRPEGAEPDLVRGAVAEWADAAQSGTRHPVDAAYGAEITRLLAAAEAQLSAR